MLESDTRSKRVIAAGRITPGFTCTHHRATIGLNGECLLCGRTPQATIWKCPSGIPEFPGSVSAHEFACQQLKDGWVCTREPNHPGRHIAAGALFGLVAAWPGEHRPTEADLELPVELPRARAEAFTPMQAVTA